MLSEDSRRVVGRHAFLIMAHADPHMLATLLKALDHPRNDVFLHVDSKSEIEGTEMLSLLRRAHGTLLKPQPIHWGGYSLIGCTLRLLEEAARSHHDYYHLMSGSDLPLVPQAELHAFFDANLGLEFIHILDGQPPASVVERVSLRHFFVDRPTSTNWLLSRLRSKTTRAALAVQRRLRRRTLDGGLKEVAWGSQWFSITHDFAQHLLSQEPWIRSRFRHSVCGDEHFVQMTVKRSRYAASVAPPITAEGVNSARRLIDWRRSVGSSPHVWRSGDLPTLREAAVRGAMFARKFDSRVDSEVIDHVLEWAGAAHPSVALTPGEDHLASPQRPPGRERPLRVLVSAGWLGGAGGAERNLYSTLRALEGDDVDVVVRQRLDGPWSVVGARQRVFLLSHWRWYGSGHANGLKGMLFQRVLNSVRRRVGRPYDVHIRLLGGGHISPAARASLSLLVPSGNTVDPRVAAEYDAVALQAPDNVALIPAGVPTVFLPPPVYDLADGVRAPQVALPDSYFLTVFNPYDRIKGADDLALALSDCPLPIVWCHSARTVAFDIPSGLADHPGLIHVDDPTPEEMRYLYERCRGYLSFSLTEGFGWSTADALRYSRAVVTRPLGIFSNPEAWQQGTFRVGERWQVDWDAVLAVDEDSASQRDLTLISGDAYRKRLVTLGGWS